ncbi:MAG: N-acetylmuramic acid 6-phosphate etherase [Acidobacteria bacterium]|nr:N-acetylmuramic acid 6-phosphate etherase [Acidobacteriota bacterium]
MKPLTEQTNPHTRDIDRRSTLEIVTLINQEDQKVAEAVAQVLPQVAAAIDLIVERLQAEGRLFYVGAGTSGRLGVLDASECPPTFGVPPDLVQGIIAGGPTALHSAIEGAEDNPTQAAIDLHAIGVSSQDAVVGISANGNTPYTVGALEFAQQLGAAAIAITCNEGSRLTQVADVAIVPVVGAEVIAGSSRMKAGTAQKLILNMLSTGTMIRMGWVYSNLMANLKATNEKLRRRARLILADETGLDAEAAARIFAASGNDLRLALVMTRLHLSREEAVAKLAACGGSVRRALDSLEKTDEV